MGYPLDLAFRYLRSKKRDFISVGTAFAILGVALGVAALVTVMSVTGGFEAEFRKKILGVNAHVLILKYSADFREYRDVMEKAKDVEGVVAVAPFSINPMMLTHGEETASGVLLKGVDPERSLGVGAPPGTVPVLDLPEQLKDGGDLSGLRLPGTKPAQDPKPPPMPTVGMNPADAPSGSSEPILKVIENQIAESESGGALDDEEVELPLPPFDPDALPDEDDEEELDPFDAPTGTSDVDAEPEDGADAGLDEEAPVGSVEPEGGYESVLPDDDILPDDVDTDPCDDQEAVAKLPGIVVGVTLAEALDLKLGDCVTVTSPTVGVIYSGDSIKPAVAKQFRVIAMFEAGFDQYDSKLVYTDLYEAQIFYDHGDTVTGVEMRVDDIEQAEAIAQRLDEKLDNPVYHTMDWMELNRGLFKALWIQRVGMSTVLALIIVVAAFTVIATLIMVVLDKKKEIAVLKAMGATDDAILRAFLYQGAIIGGVGTTIGLLLGFAVCKGLLVYAFPLDPKVYFISQLPVQARPQEFLITGAIAIGICLLATIVPSLYAARLRPAEGFREQ